MLRHFISHFHEYTSKTTPLHHPLLLSKSNPRWYDFNLDENPFDDNFDTSTMKAEKPKTLKMLDPCRSPPPKRPRKERNRGKQSGIPPSSETIDEEIWKELPEDLLEAIIARLPISTFFHFRLVCQKWNSLLNSPTFSQHCAEVHPSHPWFYTITHENINTGALYDPTMKKWRHPAPPSLPPKVILLPVASAGGLVCFLDIGHRYFYVCNPLTHSWKELPSRSVKVWSRLAVGMIQNGKGYMIIWIDRDGEYEIYDSQKNSWTRPGRSLPLNIKPPLTLNFRSHSVSIARRIYFMRSDPEGIVCYDMDSLDWSQYLIPTPPDSSDHTLARCGTRVLLVGLVTKNAATCVCIWELQKMMLLWKEVDRMPNEQCLEFYGKHVRMTCLGNVGLLMLSLRSRQMNRIVTYDADKGDWSKVAGCVLPSGGRKRQWIACGTAFYPCLTATP